MEFPRPSRIQWKFRNGTKPVAFLHFHTPFVFTFCPFIVLQNTRITRKSTTVVLTADWHAKRNYTCFAWCKNWNLGGYLNLLPLTKPIGPISLHVLSHSVSYFILWCLFCYETHLLLFKRAGGCHIYDNY